VGNRAKQANVRLKLGVGYRGSSGLLDNITRCGRVVGVVKSFGSMESIA
jgi:hypothetical protein